MSGPNYLSFKVGDGPCNSVCWPNPFFDDEDMAWRLRNGTFVHQDLLWVQSVLQAYSHLFEITQKERNRMVSLVKAEASKDAQAEDDAA